MPGRNSTGEILCRRALLKHCKNEVVKIGVNLTALSVDRLFRFPSICC